MKKLRTLSFLLIIVLGAFAVAPALGQSTSGTAEEQVAPPDTASPPPIEAIPASEIPKQAEQAASQLSDIRTRLSTPGNLAAIRDELPKVINDLTILKASTAEKMTDAESMRRLFETRQQWETVRSKLEGWQSTLKSQSEQLGKTKQRLEGLKQLWGKTSEVASEQELPEAIVARVQSIQADIRSTDSLLVGQRDSVLTLQDKISQELIDIGQIFTEIESAQSRARGQLLAIDSPPLWKAFEAGQTNLAAQIRETLRSRSGSIEGFFDLAAGMIPVTIVVFVLILFLLIMLGRAVRSMGAEDGDDAATHILSRPFSSAILITLLFSIWFYPSMPSSVRDVVGLLFLLPLLRLVPGLMPPDLRLGVYSVAVVYFLDQLRGFTLDYSFLERTVVLVLSVFTFSALLWIHQRIPPRSDVVVQLRRTLGIYLTRLGMILLSVSIISNLIGNVSLAILLSEGVVAGFYASLIVFVGIQIILGTLAVMLRTKIARHLKIVQHHTPAILRRVATLVRYTGVFVWLYSVLDDFRLRTPIIDGLTNFLTESRNIGTVEFSAAEVLAAVLIAWLSVQIGKFTRIVLEGDVLPRFRLQHGIPLAIARVTQMLIVVVGFVLAAGASGLELDKITILAGAFGVGIGFGMQNVVNNFVSGLILMFERPIRVGDTVEFNTRIGEVKRIGIRSSTVRTFDGSEVIVPNGDLISKEVVNWTLSDRRRRIEIDIGVKYGTDPNKVLEILKDVADKHPEIMKDPEPRALFQAHGDSSLNFQLRCWTGNFDEWVKTKSELTVALNTALAEANIEIPFPQRDLHLRSIDPEAGAHLGPGSKES